MGESSFSYRTGFAEGLEAGRATRRRLFPLFPRLVIVAAVLAPMFAGMVVGLFLAQPFGISQFGPVLMLLGMVAGIFAGRPLASAAERWSVKRLGGMASAEDVDVTLSMDDEGIRFIRSNVDCKVGWGGIDQVFVNRGTLFFVISSGAYFVPLRCFASPELRQATIDFALARMKPEARQRSRL